MNKKIQKYKFLLDQFISLNDKDIVQCVIEKNNLCEITFFKKESRAKQRNDILLSSQLLYVHCEHIFFKGNQKLILN